MMNNEENDCNYIIVNATALSSGGALTILRQFLSSAYRSRSKKAFICFVPEGICFDSYPNIIYIPVKRKGWVKRILWDSYGLKLYLKKNNICFGNIISLQDTSVNVSAKQIIYLHQPIPFSDIDFLRKESFSLKLFLYKKFYSYFIFRYVKKNTTFVVQTEWMAQALRKRVKNEVHIIKPDFILPQEIQLFQKPQRKSDSGKISLLYPAIPQVYKNHMVLLDALRNILSDDGLKDKKIVLQVTFEKGGYRKFDKYISKHNISNNIEFLGCLEYSSMMDAYLSADIILFPSFVESFGLPLLEASALGKYIICSDLPYAREVLEKYENVDFIKYDSSTDWSETIKNHIKNAMNKKKSCPDFVQEFCSSNNWEIFFKLL